MTQSNPTDETLQKPPYSLVGNLVTALGGGNKKNQIQNGIKKARTIRDKGLMTIPLKLFKAMKAAAVTSGLIEWGYTQLDTMHFEFNLIIKPKKK